MNNNARWLFGGCVVISLLCVAMALHFWGAAEIRADYGEVVFLTFACAAWLVLMANLFKWFGLSLRDDALERNNTGALVALCGAIVSAALLYAGGSIGEGPSYANNVFSVGLAAAGFLSLWLLLEIGGDISVSIAEERDLASGVRLCGFLLSIALVLGRAVAGDWHSASGTFHDFINEGWPVVVICMIAVLVEHFVRPNRRHPSRMWATHGLLPAVFYLALAGAWLGASRYVGRNASMMTAMPTRFAEPDVLRRNAKEISGMRAGPAINAVAFSSIRRRALLDGCKWDPQVGDDSTLSPFPLVMKSSTWNYLADCAEKLATEAAIAETEISRRPELIDELGLPRALRSVLGASDPLTPAAGRVMRFDFHYTTDGWRISEANSDVPGGFAEASHFTGLIADHFPNLRPAGNPASAWTDALAATAGEGGVVALLSAPGYMEDHQVIAFLAAKLRDCGCRAGLAKPEQIFWRNGDAQLDTSWHCGPVNAIVRFYQAEWLTRLPARCEWKYFFRNGKTPMANPPLAVISESKRFPLVWDRLSSRLPTWRALLPETRDPRRAPWSRDAGWLLKTSMCNNGDTVSARDWMRPRDWLRTRLAARLRPGNWIAQRRFESVPVATPDGPQHACVGVYTVNGKAAGAYTRLSRKPVIDFAAVDVALLIEDDE